VCLFVCPSFSQPCGCISVYLFIHLFVYMLVHLSVCLSCNPMLSIHLSAIHPNIPLSVCLSVPLCVSPFICLSLHMTVCLSFRHSADLFLFPFVCLSICLSINISKNHCLPEPNKVSMPSAATTFNIITQRIMTLSLMKLISSQRHLVLNK
jgi:hypothetical protein